MSERITDLEKFALQHIMRPYWPLLIEKASYDGLVEFKLDQKAERYDRLTHSIEQVAKLLDVGPIEWRMAVFDRLFRIGFFFPYYVEHKLVHVVMSGMSMAAANAAKPSGESL